MEKRAYAKLNLSLDITGRAENGYHTLDMVMQTISLYDIVRAKRSSDIKVSCLAGCPIEKNTVYRAAKLFFEHTGLTGGACFEVKKNIPEQAGLGGGSSDAAAALMLLNEMYETKLSDCKLQEIAVEIGADVPFFIVGGCKRAQGIGEELQSIKNNCNFKYLLIKPKNGVGTQEAYEKYHSFDKVHIDTQKVVESLGCDNKQQFYKHAKNALERAGIAICSEVEEILVECKTLGADFAMMTGSGSCVFAVFEDEKLLAIAQEKLEQKYPFCKTAHDVF